MASVSRSTRYWAARSPRQRSLHIPSRSRLTTRFLHCGHVTNSFMLPPRGISPPSDERRSLLPPRLRPPLVPALLLLGLLLAPHRGLLGIPADVYPRLAHQVG